MKHPTIGNVMTSDVISARTHTPFKTLVELLRSHDISGLPVLDDDDKVLGVVSETDLMAHQAAVEARGRTGRLRLPWRGRLVPGTGTRKAVAEKYARTAEQLMSRPAITVRPQDTLVDAARTMTRHGVERLPVIDEEGRLVGIVTRRDLLQTFLRSDAEVRAEVVDEVLVRALWLAPDTVDAHVADGVVTLTGQMEWRSDAATAVRLAGQVDGVVAVADHLTWGIDDTRARSGDTGLPAATGDWLRGA